MATASAPPTEQRTFTSVEPVTGDTVAEFPVCGRREVAAAVREARLVAPWWRSIGADQRSRRLARWRHRIWDGRDELATLIHRENGKTWDDAIVEIGLVVEHIRWAERHALRELSPRKVSPGLLFANFSARVEHRPLGVVGVIGPWNYPLYAPNSSAAFALAAGNTVIIKPSELTPAVMQWYVEAFRWANPDAPDGVLSLVTGDGGTGEALCRAGVDKIAFTGSTTTGRAVMAVCALTVTPVVMELGGKDAAIVAADADLTAAARAIAWGAYSNSGQTCVGVERVYAVREVSDELTRLITAELRDVTVGSGATDTYGAMTMQAQIDVVRRHVAKAVDDGGRIVVGTAEVTGPGDCFLNPTLLRDVPEWSKAIREETFGPVLTITTVDDIDEAIRLTNDSSYALSASVFSRRRAEKIAGQLDVGQVSINSVVAFAGMGAVPMGGVRGSGFGRLHGREGLLEFTRPLSVIRKRFPIPGFEPIALHRGRAVLPLTSVMLGLRHGR